MADVSSCECVAQLLPDGGCPKCSPQTVTTLTLFDCNLKEIPDLSKCSSLSYLNVSCNEIKQVNEERFYESGKKLECLDLSRNQLISLPSSLERSLTRLQVLRVSHNNLTNISSFRWASLTSLKELWLSHNQLTNFLITVKALSKCESLIHLVLTDGNPWTDVKTVESQRKLVPMLLPQLSTFDGTNPSLFTAFHGKNKGLNVRARSTSTLSLLRQRPRERPLTSVMYGVLTYLYFLATLLHYYSFKAGTRCKERKRAKRNA